MSKLVERVYYTKQTQCSTKHNFYLDTAIEYREVYREMIDTLLTVPETDEVHIYINTPGGSASIGISIVNAMRNCAAKITGHLMSECHSMGTFILLECDEFVVNEDIILLFHAYSGWNFGKGKDTVVSAQKNHEWLATFFRNVYYPFFSKEEIEQIMPEDGRGATDYYIFYDEMVERLQKVQDYRAKQSQEEQDKIDELVAKALVDSTDDRTESEDTGVLYSVTSEESETTG